MLYLLRGGCDFFQKKQTIYIYAYYSEFTCNDRLNIIFTSVSDQCWLVFSLCSLAITWYANGFFSVCGISDYRMRVRLYALFTLIYIFLFLFF